MNRAAGLWFVAGVWVNLKVKEYVMKVARMIFGGVLGAIPGILLLPVLEFYSVVVVVGGVVAGAMAGSAPEGRWLPAAAGGTIGLVVGAGLGLFAGPLALIIAPIAAFYGAKRGIRGSGVSPPPLIQH